jgi:hypothetical protein
VRRLGIASVIVLVPLAAYVAAALADGPPRFPTRDECVHAPVEGEPVDLVFGRVDDPASGEELRDAVVAVGFLGVESLPDGCGRWKVVLEDVPSADIAREVQAEAASVELATTLERSSEG